MVLPVMMVSVSCMIFFMMVMMMVMDASAFFPMSMDFPAFRAANLREQLFLQGLASFHDLQQLFAGKLRDRSCNDGRFCVDLPEDLHAFLNLLLLCFVGPAQDHRPCIFNLVAEKFTEILAVDPALRHIDHGRKAVQLRVDLLRHILHGLDHIRELSHTGRFDQDPFRMIRVHNLLQGFSKISYQRAADTTGIHLPDLNAGILQKSTVNPDLSKFIFNQDNLLSCEYFLQHFLNECCFSCSQKAGNNINLRHDISLLLFPVSVSVIPLLYFTLLFDLCKS